MSTLTYAAADSLTMTGRNVRRFIRYPSLFAFVVGSPVVFLLLFVFVFGGTLGDGLGGTSGGRAAYVEFVTPTILLLTVVGTAQGTAIAVASDMTSGIIARFRTMAISRAAVLNGHVLATVLQALACLVIVAGVALGVGWRPSASPLEWLAAAGILVLVTLAVTWLSVWMGLAAKSVETASNTPMLLLLLPFLGSGFVPTDSMPAALRWFAQYQPFTPFIDTLRALLSGRPVGDAGWQAVAWAVGLSVLGYVLARPKYTTRPVR